MSVTTTRKLGKKETQKIRKKIKEIQNKSTTDMINELKKEGIEVSGKSKTVVKIFICIKKCVELISNANKKLLLSIFFIMNE